MLFSEVDIIVEHILCCHSIQFSMIMIYSYYILCLFALGRWYFLFDSTVKCIKCKCFLLHYF